MGWSQLPFQPPLGHCLLFQTIGRPACCVVEACYAAMMQDIQLEELSEAEERRDVEEVVVGYD